MVRSLSLFGFRRQLGSVSHFMINIYCGHLKDLQNLFSQLVSFGYLEEENAQCFLVESSINRGFFLLSAGAILLALLNSFITKAAVQYARDYDSLATNQVVSTGNSEERVGRLANPDDETRRGRSSPLLLTARESEVIGPSSPWNSPRSSVSDKVTFLGDFDETTCIPSLPPRSPFSHHEEINEKVKDEEGLTQSEPQPENGGNLKQLIEPPDALFTDRFRWFLVREDAPKIYKEMWTASSLEDTAQDDHGEIQEEKDGSRQALSPIVCVPAEPIMSSENEKAVLGEAMSKDDNIGQPEELPCVVPSSLSASVGEGDEGNNQENTDEKLSPGAPRFDVGNRALPKLEDLPSLKNNSPSLGASASADDSERDLDLQGLGALPFYNSSRLGASTSADSSDEGGDRRSLDAARMATMS
jgi:hypothetical protein